MLVISIIIVVVVVVVVVVVSLGFILTGAGMCPVSPLEGPLQSAAAASMT